MANNKNQKPQPAAFPSFSGIDTRSYHAPAPAVTDLVNFRLDANGSLHKREGTRLVKKFPDPIRAVWSGKLMDNIVHTFFLCGHLVYHQNADKQGDTVLGSISTTVGEAQFCFYRDRLYLLDGVSLYQVDAASVFPIEAYPPLIGRNWTTTILGEVYEPLNLLTRRARIHYVVAEHLSAFLRVPYSLDTVDALFVNGVRVPETSYEYDEPTKSILYAGLAIGDEVLAYVTFASSDRIPSNPIPNVCTRLQCVGDTPNTRLLFWNGAKKNTVYPSHYLTEESLTDIKEVFPTCAPLYIPIHTESVLGDGRNAVTGFLRHYDRLLVFTENEAFVVHEDMLTCERLSANIINPAVGCASADACTMTENFPVTVGLRGFYRWTADTDEYTEANARSICDGIRSQLSDEFLRTAKVFYSRLRNELWFYSSTQKENVWIYRLDGESWVRFTGIEADEIFESEGKICFRRRNALFVFDSDAYEDEDESGNTHEIVAELQSNLLEYGTHAEKHFRSLCLHGDCGGGTITVSLTGDGIGTVTCSFSESEAHTAAQKRLFSGRFRYATLHLRAGGRARQSVYSIVSEVR